jgi:LysR family glycine cleavage system transcriptional activator
MYAASVTNLPPLAALRAFEAAARHLSFRAAADELSVTQSAISHQVAELERRLGLKLFERHSRRVELTPAGELYHPALREAFDRIAHATQLVTATAGGGELDVQVYVTVAVRWLIPRLHSFTAAHPEIKVRFNTSHIGWEFDDTAGDVGIVCTEQADRPNLHYTHLFDDQLTPVCAPTLRPLRTPADLLTHPLLQLFTAPEEWPIWLAAAGLPPTPPSTISFDSYLLALESAFDGQGVAIVPRFLAASDLRSGRLIAPFPIDVPNPKRWYLVCRRDRANDTRVVAFREWLREELTTEG